MEREPHSAVACGMEDLPVTRGAWLPIDVAAELLRLDAAEIRRWVADGALSARVVEGVEFVPLHELIAQAKRSTNGSHEPSSQPLEE